MTAGYPAVLHLAGRRCLVVGGGPVAARKVARLLSAGANVEVVAPEVEERLVALATRTEGGSGGRGRLTVRQRAYRSSDVTGAWLVVAATDDPHVNARVAEDADRAGGFVNRADDGAAGTCTLPASASDGTVTITASTRGASPAFARWLARILLESTRGRGAPGVLP